MSELTPPSFPGARKRVVHVIDSLGVGGGAEQQLVSNLGAFSDPRIEHQLVCLYRDPHQTRAADLPPGMEVSYLFDATPGSQTSILLRLNRMLARLQPSLVHCSLPRSAMATRLVGRRAGIPVVESLVNISHEWIRTVDNPNVSVWKLRAHRTLDRATMRWVTLFHALSEAVAESWHTVVGIPRSKIRVIPRGVNLRLMEAAPVRSAARSMVLGELALDPDTFLILSIGRHEAQKGQRYLVESMPMIRQAIPNAVLVVAGQPGTLTSRLEEMIAELSMANAITLLGRRTDVPTLLRAADVFVFPSLFEGMGVTLLEAMAAGLSCITTRQPPMTEIITDGVDGLLVGPRDPPAIARAVIEVANDRARSRRLGQAAQDRIAANFTVERAARQLEKLYLEVLGDPPRL
jgi:glycosyltransferase involved in cell wall biosynthesis